MKYNVYYQSLTLASVGGGVSDYFTVEIGGLGQASVLAEAYGLQLFSTLCETIVCVICDETDRIEAYFRVEFNGIVSKPLWSEVYCGLKAVLNEQGAFVADGD